MIGFELSLADFIRLLAFGVWLSGLAMAGYAVWRIVRSLKTGRLLRIKRLLLFRAIALVLLGIVPLIARIFILQGHEAHEEFLALASLTTAFMYPLSTVPEVLILQLDPYDPKNEE